MICFVLNSQAQPGPGARGKPSGSCSQPKNVRDALIRQAEEMRFTVRRVEFVGTTYTRDEVLRRRMTNFQEGDIFTRRTLLNSLQNMSKLRNEIYPVKLSEVELRLNESEQTVDMAICFSPKRL
jgi:outer membrane protein assembly factor BamA